MDLPAIADAEAGARVLLLEQAHVRHSGALAMGMDGVDNAVIPGRARRAVLGPGRGGRAAALPGPVRPERGRPQGRGARLRAHRPDPSATVALATAAADPDADVRAYATRL